MLAYAHQLALFVAALAALQACAPQQPPIHYWSKPGATYDDFLKDRYACIQDARSRVSDAFVQGDFGAASSDEVITANIFLPCMAARGYREDPTGPFGPPPGGGIRVH